ncbi:MAG: hypothetical protein IKE75_02095 [Bacilli bacterium]|nr:hypothetical protein [Bacilli bacterium]
MNVEELKQLKSQLVDEFKYVIAPELICAEPNKVSDPKTKNEILSEVKTDEFIAQCEKVFEDSVRFLLSKGINFDTIDLSGIGSGIVCSTSLHERLSELDQEWIRNHGNSKQISTE